MGALDLVFLVDNTGSMGGQIAQVQRRLTELIGAIEQSPLARKDNIRFGLVAYSDHGEPWVTQVSALSADRQQIRGAVDRMRASGGGDGPEAVTDGFHEAARLDWRPHAARWVLCAP